MDECGLKPIDIHIREGLSCTNGTSVMTGISAVNQIHAENLLRWATLAAVWMNEIAGSYDDLMSAPLNEYRRHEGQIAIAKLMREWSKGSQRLRKREVLLYDTPAINDVLDNTSFVGNYVVVVRPSDAGTDEVVVRISLCDNSILPNDAVKLLKDHFRSRLRVAPKVEILPPDVIQQINFPPKSRKPVKFIDER